MTPQDVFACLDSSGQEWGVGGRPVLGEILEEWLSLMREDTGR